MVRRSAIKEDPDLVPLFEGTESNRWIGARRHIIVSLVSSTGRLDCTEVKQAYPIDSGDLLNMSTTQPDRNFVQADTWTASGSKSEMLDTFHDFCPRVRKLLELVPDGEVLEWKLRVHKPLPIWVTGHVALIGDACHPTLPHIAQGAAQAIEDAAALGVIFGKLQSTEEVASALKVYQALRKPRADFAVMTAAENSKGLLTDDKAARDASFDMAKNGGNTVDKMISRYVA
jgi:salicylate hydroxylase